MTVLAEGAMLEFQDRKPEHAVLLGDSKSIDDAHYSHERLSILVSGAPGHSEGKLLSVPSLVDDEGHNTSTAKAPFEGVKET